MKKIVWQFQVVMVCFAGLAYADDAAILQTLKKLAIQEVLVQPSPVEGLKTVMTENGVLYVTADGRYMLQGPLYKVSDAEPVNVTHQLLSKKLQAMSSTMIVYKAPEEKHVVTVFTDISCGFCRKLHQQMKEYNDLGITIRYLAFPRQGPGSQAAKEMQSIWCQASPGKSLDKAMKGEAITSTSVNCKKDLSEHYRLGVWFGIQGTPAMVLQNGMVVPGYQEPKEMLKMLNASGASAGTSG